MAIEIIGTGRAVPINRVSNNDLAAKIDTNDEWIRSHTGIGSRHFAEETEACSDLAAESAKNALAMAAGYTGGDLAQRDSAAASAAKTIDVIVVATATADYFGTPSTACVVQHMIGAPQAAAMDITVGCTGFVYGLETAAGLLLAGAQRKRALVIGSEILSKMINWDDRGSCVLFGDGAGAVVLEKTENCRACGCGVSGADFGGMDRSGGLLHSILCADGSGAESLVMRRGGSRSPYKKGEVVEKTICIEMNGQEVYNFAVKAITGTIEALLKEGNINIDDVARIVPHQANARIVQAASKRLHIPIDNFI